MTLLRIVQARSAADAARRLRAHAPHAQPIAAGADLLALWKEGVLDRADVTPVWVDLAGASDLARIDALPGGGWRLGAMATLQQLQRTPGMAPLLVDAVARIASPQLRVRTTLGGNLLQRPRCWYFRHPDVRCFKKGGQGCPAVGGPLQAHPGAVGAGPCHAAHPSDLATALLALDARAEIVSPDGTRRASLPELYRGAAANREREAQLAPDDVLVALHVPPSAAAQAFEKVASRAANEFAAASAAVVLQLEGDRIAHARVALGGIAAEPLRCDAADAALRGQAWREVDVGQVAGQLTASLHIAAPTHVRAAWCRWALERALARALARR